MQHPAEDSDRNTALYLIGSRARRLVTEHGARDAKNTCSSVTLNGDLRLTLWDPDEQGSQMLTIYDGWQTVLTCHLDHQQPQGPARNYYPRARVLVSTWNRGTWQRRLFEETVESPKPPPKKGLRLVHSRNT